MTFLSGITHLTNWMGNVIMPTLAGLFFARSVVRYQNFSQILNTARGTNTAFLFSMQSLPQLLKVGKGFKDDVTSAPNTKIAMRTQDEEKSKFFIRASAEHTVMKLSLIHI